MSTLITVTTTRSSRRRLLAILIRALLWVAALLAITLLLYACGGRWLNQAQSTAQWVKMHSALFLGWRVLLYGVIGWGWWRMRRRLLIRERSEETLRRLRRSEMAAIASAVLLETSVWLGQS